MTLILIQKKYNKCWLNESEKMINEDKKCVVCARCGKELKDNDEIVGIFQNTTIFGINARYYCSQKCADGALNIVHGIAKKILGKGKKNYGKSSL